MKIGMLSAAHVHAASYAERLKQIDGVDFAGVWDDDQARGQAFASRFGTRFFPAPEALLAEQLDGVIICAENARHRPLTELAAPATRYILCEKPIATMLEDAQAMLDVCAAHDARLQIAFPVRFVPAVQQLKQLLDQQALGRIYSLKTTNHGTMPGGWFTDPALSGGGAVLDHTVHVVDLLRWFWGAEVTEVYAEIGYGLLHEGVTIDDAGMLSFKLSTGAYGTLDTSWSRPKAFPTWGDVTIEVLGEHGVVRLDAFRQHLDVYSNRTGKAEWMSWGSDMDLALLQDFVSAIREGREPSITGYDGLKALEVALAAYRSAKAGEPIRLAAG